MRERERERERQTDRQRERGKEQRTIAGRAFSYHIDMNKFIIK